MNWPEAMVTIAGMVCFVHLIKTILKFAIGKNRF